MRERGTPPLTKGERDSIVERDEHTGQMRGYDEERGWHKKDGYCPDKGATCQWFEVHHVKPRGAGGTNDPENLITLFACHHTGKCPGGRIR